MRPLLALAAISVIIATSFVQDVTAGYDNNYGCDKRSLGYNYRSTYNDRKGQDTGTIASMPFKKKYANTVLRLTYSSNIRVIGAGATVRYSFQIDGHECLRPTPVDIGMHKAQAVNDHVPAVLLGICEATAAGPIGPGGHAITVNIGHVQRHGKGDAYSNWESTSFLEVQEMCPPY